MYTKLNLLIIYFLNFSYLRFKWFKINLSFFSNFFLLLTNFKTNKAFKNLIRQNFHRCWETHTQITVHDSQIPTIPPEALKWIFQNMQDKSILLRSGSKNELDSNATKTFIFLISHFLDSKLIIFWLFLVAGIYIISFSLKSTGECKKNNKVL